MDGDWFFAVIQYQKPLGGGFVVLDAGIRAEKQLWGERKRCIVGPSS